MFSNEGQPISGGRVHYLNLNCSTKYRRVARSSDDLKTTLLNIGTEAILYTGGTCIPGLLPVLPK